MILDGYWKRELNNYARRLKFWCKICRGSRSYSEHQINKNLLYSAAIIRKLIEDETDAKKELSDSELPLPKLALLSYKLPVMEFQFDGEKDCIIHRVIADYYHEGHLIKIEAKIICNQIIHSYVWSLAYSKEKKGVIGFFIASDREKEKKLFFVKITDWIKYINYCRVNCAV